MTFGVGMQEGEQAVSRKRRKEGERAGREGGKVGGGQREERENKACVKRRAEGG